MAGRGMGRCGPRPSSNRLADYAPRRHGRYRPRRKILASSAVSCSTSAPTILKAHFSIHSTTLRNVFTPAS